MSEYQKYLDCEHRWGWGMSVPFCRCCELDHAEWEWIQKCAALEAQRDELLVACEGLLRDVEHEADSLDAVCDNWLTVKVARAAITNAKMEGDSDE